MANNTISFRNTELFDKGAIAESMPYIKNGLTYKSNNTSIHPRDEAGNIVFQENSETNPLLIIEPVTPNISTKSVLRVVDTSFQYFKFPVAASIDAVEIVTSDLELDLTDIDFDTIYARYKPATDLTVASGSIYSGILMDGVVDGLPQTNTNCYTVSKEAKNSGKDLRFRIQLTHQFNGPSPNNESTLYFSIIKVGPNTALNRRWREPFASSRVLPTIDFNSKIQSIATTMRDICYDPAFEGSNRDPWVDYYRYFNPNAEVNGWNTLSTQTRLSGNQLDAIDYVLTRDAKKVPKTTEESFKTKRNLLKSNLADYNLSISEDSNSYGFINLNTIQTVNIDETIKNSDFEIGDIFQIGQKAGHSGHTILNNQTYWVITDASKTVDEWNQEIIE